MRIFSNTHFQFIGFRRKAMLSSFVVIVVGLVSIVAHRGFNMSIDFTGGTLVEVRFDQPVPLQRIREIVNSSGFPGAEITLFGESRSVLIKFKRITEATEAAEKIEKALANSLKDRRLDIRRVESVGPKIGGELQQSALWAIVWSLAGILAYIGWRFHLRYAVGAIVALVHDVLITLGFFSLTNKEISIAVVAAILTVVGYSLNDTIVVFDRIRENVKARGRGDFAEVVNSSINETLSRTIITSLTTIMVVLCLALFGGPVLLDFSLALLIGVAVGTYSSIFIASPILVEWEAWQRVQYRRRPRPDHRPRHPHSTKAAA